MLPAMVGPRDGWDSFWDLGTPEEVADWLVEEHGNQAKHAAARCARQARLDGRSSDHWFWVAVLCRLLGR